MLPSAARMLARHGARSGSKRMLGGGPVRMPHVLICAQGSGDGNKNDGKKPTKQEQLVQGSYSAAAIF